MFRPPEKAPPFRPPPICRACGSKSTTAWCGCAPANRPQTVFLATPPMFHLSGLYANIVLQLSMGGKLVIRPGRFDPEAVLQLIQKERITAWAALGSMGPRVAKHPKLGE